MEFRRRRNVFFFFLYFFRLPVKMTRVFSPAQIECFTPVVCTRLAMSEHYRITRYGIVRVWKPSTIYFIIVYYYIFYFTYFHKYWKMSIKFKLPNSCRHDPKCLVVYFVYFKRDRKVFPRMIIMYLIYIET